MVDLCLDFDEGILLETERVRWINSDVIFLEALILTNKNIYLAFKKNTGLFSKPELEIIRRPLTDIKIINGQPMVDQVKNDNHGICLQIQFIQGREQFSFDEAAKKNSSNWVNELYKVLIGTEAPVEQKAGKLGGIVGGFGGIAANLKNVADSAVQSVSSTAKQVANQASASYGNTMQQIKSGKQEQVQAQAFLEQTYSQMSINESPNSSSKGGFCSNCGNRIAQGTKFCTKCGAPVGATTLQAATPPIPSSTTANSTVRHQEFVGTILKCPNCGAVISQTTAICPECGHHITGQSAVSSVERFNNQLMALETTRKKPLLGMFNMYAPADPVDKKKLALIRNYPIPNTVDDICEFMMLAIANIDVSLSKKSLLNNTTGMEVLAMEMPKVLSNAWVSKMKQAYQKAKMAFPNDPAFENIKSMYIEKMKELKMKIEE